MARKNPSTSVGAKEVTEHQPFIKKITIKNLPAVDLPSGALVFVVGPNNGGKSTFLNEIQARVTHATGTKWIEKVEWDLGTQEQFNAFVDKGFKPHSDERYLKDIRSGGQVARDDIVGFYSRNRTHNPSFLIRLLNAQSRIGLADRTTAANVIDKIETHPYHRFFFETGVEASFSKKMQAAFKKDFRINRTGGEVVGYLGSALKSERLSVEYEHSVITSMQPLHEFGDGVRSYTGILLNSVADPRPVTIVDEPEAFLHPPQARRLGQEMATAAMEGSQQVFVATHSSDFIRGALSSKNTNIIFIYLEHSNKKRPLFEVSRVVVEEFSKKPFLSHTSALDALFYEQAVVCEGEADIMFFKWALEGTDVAKRLEESFWISSYGKSAVPGILADMKKLGVRARCVFDLDVLLSEDILAKICATLELPFDRYKKMLRSLQTAIKVPPAVEALERISQIVGKIEESSDDEPSRLMAIREIKKSAESLGKSWVLKTTGLSIVPKGSLYAEVTEFIELMRKNGVLILEEGEIENFVPTVRGHGQSWVRTAIESGSLTPAAQATLVRQFKPLIGRAN